MASNEQPTGSPSPEEAVFLALEAGDFAPAVDNAFAKLAAGQSADFLSVVRPDLLIGAAEALLPVLDKPVASSGEGYKSVLFDRYLELAAQGDPAAISALPKLATTSGELALALTLALDNKDAVREWRDGRPYIQNIGSFNPQHVGHRDTLGAAIAAAGDKASGIMQAVANHPIKKDSIPPYDGRFRAAEERVYTSNILDPTTATMLDMPLSLGLAKQGTAQIDLIARTTGDSESRWIMGSDKFLKDTGDVQQGKALDKAGARFERVHLYVARRATDSLVDFNNAVDYVRDRFGANITVLPESTRPGVLAAAASSIRALRAEGRNEEADRMEFPDIVPMKR